MVWLMNDRARVNIPGIVPGIERAVAAMEVNRTGIV